MAPQRIHKERKKERKKEKKRKTDRKKERKKERKREKGPLLSHSQLLTGQESDNSLF